MLVSFQKHDSDVTKIDYVAWIPYFTSLEPSLEPI